MSPGLDRTVLFGALRADTMSTGRAVSGTIRHRPVRPAALGRQTALPPPARPVHDLEEALRRRTAVRDYAAQPLRLDQVSALLAAADAQDAGNWAGERAAGVGLNLLCAAWRVSTLDSGLYGYDTGTLGRIAALPTGPAAAELVLQREFADAPALVVVLGDLAAALDRHGSHGYRLLLTRAGAAAHAAWLTALRLGLNGTVFAGLLPTALRELAGVDGYTSAPLFAFSVGWPPDPPSDPRPTSTEGR